MTNDIPNLNDLLVCENCRELYREPFDAGDHCVCGGVLRSGREWRWERPAELADDGDTSHG